jgi:hypothetical protein
VLNVNENLGTTFIASVEELVFLGHRYYPRRGRAEAGDADRLDAIARALEAACPESMAAIPAETLGGKLLAFYDPYNRLVDDYLYGKMFQRADTAELDALLRRRAKEDAVHKQPVPDFQLTVDEVEVLAEDYYETILGMKDHGFESIVRPENPAVLAIIDHAIDRFNALGDVLEVVRPGRMVEIQDRMWKGLEERSSMWHDELREEWLARQKTLTRTGRLMEVVRPGRMMEIRTRMVTWAEGEVERIRQAWEARREVERVWMATEARRDGEKPEHIVWQLHELARLAGEGNELAREELTRVARDAGVPDATIQAGDWDAIGNMVAAHVRELYAAHVREQLHELARLAGEGDEHAREKLTSDAQCAGVPDTTIRAGDWAAVANLVAAHVRELYATAAPAPTP